MRVLRKSTPKERRTINVTDWRIPLSDLDYGNEEANAVQHVIASKWLSMGPEVQAFEREFAAMQGAEHALAVSNATAGLHLALLALGVGAGDEVIQPALNFVAATNMTVAIGATPVFADICSLDEPTIDPSEVERAISPRTKAVVVMHYGGSLCRMAELTELCAARGIAIVEDACHAVGVAYHDARNRWPNGIMAGSIGDISAFSFFSNKNIASGEGGMVVTNRADLAERVRLLRSHGMTTLTWDRHKGHAASYDVVNPGYNYRLDELHAALGRVQLSKLERNNQRRRNLLASYREAVQSLGGWTMPFAETIEYSSGHLMVIVAPDPETKQRVVDALRQSGIQSSMHYPCITDFSGFAGATRENLEKTRQFTSSAITLPLFPTLRPDQIDEIVAVVQAVNSKISKVT
jgi:dTDP-4-amino-4,6-dideoxygalactose transaminase